MLHRFIIGLATVSLSTVAIAGDPFDDARHHLQIKENTEALAIVDGGQFDVNMQTEEGYSLLHYAAGAGNLAMVKALLARGANPNLKSQSGTTPYQMAIGTMVKAEIRNAMAKSIGGAESVSLSGAQALSAEGQSGPAAPSGNGMCAMVRAEQVNDGRSPALRPLLKAKDAVWYNHPDELIGLIEDCVGVDDQDQYGWTLLHHAADRDRVELAKILLDHGAKRSIRNKDGQTAPEVATSAEMKALLGPASTKLASPTADKRKLECRQKYEADAALASDTTGKMRAMRRWEQCLRTGRYW
ncbi:MAG: ankyrin repeat domain-containing protein [Alphaproteobacteria bacterium]|nr:ankyrin repeat domain-containing protein [Alphaproteobacteria bacterium]